MSMNPRSAAVGVFRDQRMADQAMEALRNAGFGDDQIRYSGSGASGGFLKSLFTGQGTVGGNFINDLADMNISDEEAQYYADEHHNGSAIIAVNAPDRQLEAKSILQRYGAYDYDMTHSSVGTTTSVPQPSNNVQADNLATTNANSIVQSAPQPQATQVPAQSVMQRAVQEGQQPVDPTGRPVPPPQAPVNQQASNSADPNAQIQSLQAQLQRTQQQLQDAQTRLQAAKQHETQLQASRQREVQMHTMEKQLQDAQAQLQATTAEIQATEARIASQSQQ